MHLRGEFGYMALFHDLLISAHLSCDHVPSLSSFSSSFINHYLKYFLNMHLEPHQTIVCFISTIKHNLGNSKWRKSYYILLTVLYGMFFYLQVARFLLYFFHCVHLISLASLFRVVLLLKILEFSFFLKGFLFLLLSWRIFSLGMGFWVDSSFLSALEQCTTPSSLHGFWWEIHCHLNYCSCIGKMLFSLDSFKIWLGVGGELTLLSLAMMCLGVCVFVFVCVLSK